MIRKDEPTHPQWRKSSFSGGGGMGGGNCIELAFLNEDHIAIRDSKRPHDGVLLFTRTHMTALINGIKTRAFDDLA